MAKVKGPAFSDTASGRLGRNLVFNEAGSLAFVRARPFVIDKASAKRRIQRDVFSSASEAWTSLTAAQKKEYNDRAKTLRMTGYNFWIREYVALAGNAIIGLGRIGLMRIGKGA